MSKNSGPNPSGFCMCGCGQKTLLSHANVDGYRVGEPRRYRLGHGSRKAPGTVGDPAPDGQGYMQVYDPGHPEASVCGVVRVHRLVAFEALGRPLPPNAVVHHVNGDRSDNRPANLVICEDNAYHMVLEARTRALDACGHADWWYCDLCKEWDDPANDMWHHPTTAAARHRECNRRHLREWRQRRVA